MLGLIADPVALPTLERLAVKSGDESVRYTAVWAIGRIGDPDSVIFLEKLYAFLVAHEITGLQANVLEAIGQIGSARSIMFLKTRLVGKDGSLNRDVAWSLGQIQSPAALMALETVLKDKSVDMRQDACPAIARWGGSDSIDILAEALNDESEAVRARAADYLGSTRTATTDRPLLGPQRDERTIAPLVSALGDPSDWVRKNAVSSLGRISSPMAFDAVAKRLSDPSFSVQVAAIDAIGQIRHARSTSVLSLYARQDLPTRTRKRILETLFLLNDDRCLEILKRYLHDKDTEVQGLSMLLLGWLGSARARQVLLTVDVPEQKKELKAAYQTALWLCEGPYSHQQIQQALTGNDKPIRLGACMLLLKMPSRENLEFVQRSLRDLDMGLAGGFLASRIAALLPDGRD